MRINRKKSTVIPVAVPQAQCEPSLLAEIIIAKYLLATPLYRQENVFSRLGVDITRTNMARWIITAEGILRPLTKKIKNFILSQNVIHADETRLQVLQEKNRKAQTTSYMWTLCSSKYSLPAVWFEYHEHRNQEAAQLLLHDFKGGLHVDGYDGYNKITKSPAITRIGCWQHARKGFDIAKKDGAKSGQSTAEKFLDLMQKLFLLEREWHNNTIEEITALRREKSKPIVESIKTLLDNSIFIVTPKSKLGEAMEYLSNQWKTLTVFLDNGEYELSNNRMERFIRPFAIGRKNWLFAATPEGARASAAMYSLLNTATANGIDVRKYLVTLLTELPIILDQSPKADLSDFLPWNFITQQ